MISAVSLRLLYLIFQHLLGLLLLLGRTSNDAADQPLVRVSGRPPGRAAWSRPPW
jgi:hypothetical protein